MEAVVSFSVNPLEPKPRLLGYFDDLKLYQTSLKPHISYMD